MGILSDQQQQLPIPSRSRSPHTQQPSSNNNPSDAFFPPSSASSTTSSHGNHASPFPLHIHNHPFASTPHSRRPGSPGMAFPREVNGQGEEISTDDGHSQAGGSTSHHGTQRNPHGDQDEKPQALQSEASLIEPDEGTSVRRTMSQTQSARQELARVDMVAGKKVECGGCSKLIDQTSGGIVVAFG
jgi:hypothetical protein